MDTRADMLKARIEELRSKKAKENEEKEYKAREVAAAKKAQRLKDDAEYNDAMLDCEARAILYIESLTDEKIINDFTEDKTPETYIADLCKPIDAKTVLCILTKNRKDGCNYYKTMMGDYKSYNLSTHSNLTPNEFKIMKDTTELWIQCIKKYVMKLIAPIHQDRVRLRKEKEKYDKQQRMQTEINDTNALILKRIQNVQKHTFTPLCLDNYNTLNTNDFLTMSTYDGICLWSHYKIGIRTIKESYRGMSPSFITYYESGKVPFLTRCPTCQSPTKFNYLHKKRTNGWGGGDELQSNMFSEVYCLSHYWYDCSVKKHYIAKPDGIIMKTPRRNEAGGDWHYNCWSPEGHFKSSGHLGGYQPSVYIGTKWSEWDPKDSDGKKAADEKK